MQIIQYSAYEKLIENIKKCLNDYNNRKAQSKKFELYFANGDSLVYKIPESKVAHLLGINANYLLSTSCISTNYKNSIEVLKALCNDENIYRIYQNINNSVISFNELFSDKIEEKINAFSNNIQPNVFQMEFVCKVNRNICHNNGTDPIMVDYLLCSKDVQGNYLVLGIVKDKNYYVPVTNQFYSNLIELKNSLGYLMENQELTFASRIIIKSLTDDDYKVSAVLKPREKSEKVSKLMGYKKTFNSHIGIEYDYMATAVQNEQTYENIKNLADYMKTQEPITTDMACSLPYLNNGLKEIIDIYNDGLTSTSSKADITYSKLQKDNGKMVEELRIVKEKLNTINSLLEQQKNDNVKVIEERDSYREELQKAKMGIQLVLTKYDCNK